MGTYLDYFVINVMLLYKPPPKNKNNVTSVFIISKTLKIKDIIFFENDVFLRKK